MHENFRLKDYLSSESPKENSLFLYLAEFQSQNIGQRMFLVSQLDYCTSEKKCEKPTFSLTKAVEADTTKRQRK